VFLVLGKYSGEFLKITDTSSSKKTDQLFGAVTWLWNVVKMFSLLRRDTLDITKPIDKGNVWID